MSQQALPKKKTSLQPPYTQRRNGQFRKLAITTTGEDQSLRDHLASINDLRPELSPLNNR